MPLLDFSPRIPLGAFSKSHRGNMCRIDTFLLFIYFFLQTCKTKFWRHTEHLSVFSVLWFHFPLVLGEILNGMWRHEFEIHYGGRLTYILVCLCVVYIDIESFYARSSVISYFCIHNTPNYPLTTKSNVKFLLLAHKTMQCLHFWVRLFRSARPGRLHRSRRSTW